MAFMLVMSLQEGSLSEGYRLTWNFGIYPEVISEYGNLIVRSVGYAFATTLLTLAIGYPMAYTIAFYGGRLKNALVLVVIMPFFVSFVIRTLNWRMVLSDNGLLFGTLKEMGLLDHAFRFLATPASVIFGLTYNFLPFMTLPIYVALEKVDLRLVEAARDLYAGPWRRGGVIAGAIVGGILAAGLALAFNWNIPIVSAGAAVLGAFIGSIFVSEAFVRITFPLSLPGVFAGSLLTFIPAMGDYVNAEFLGNPDTRMLGNVIQNRFLTQNDFPTASALSFFLMAGILIVVAIYARALGTEQLTNSRI